MASKPCLVSWLPTEQKIREIFGTLYRPFYMLPSHFTWISMANRLTGKFFSWSQSDSVIGQSLNVPKVVVYSHQRDFRPWEWLGSLYRVFRLPVDSLWLMKKLTSKKYLRTTSRGGLTNPISGIHHVKPPWVWRLWGAVAGEPTRQVGDEGVLKALPPRADNNCLTPAHKTSIIDVSWAVGKFLLWFIFV